MLILFSAKKMVLFWRGREGILRGLNELDLEIQDLSAMTREGFLCQKNGKRKSEIVGKCKKLSRIQYHPMGVC